MSSPFYSVPETLKREEEITVEMIELIKEAFQQLINEERDKLQKEKIKKRNERKFTYTIKDIENGWKVLFKESIEHTGEEDDKQWSVPFKVVNNVLFHSESSYERKSWSNATKLIPQGHYPEGINLEAINKDW